MSAFHPVRVLGAGVAGVVLWSFPLAAWAATGQVIVGTKEGHNQRIDNPKDNVCISFGSDTGAFLGNNTDRKIGVYRDDFCKSLITTVAPKGSVRYQGANQGFHGMKPLR
jgi:hypothetical protein